MDQAKHDADYVLCEVARTARNTPPTDEEIVQWACGYPDRVQFLVSDTFAEDPELCASLVSLVFGRTVMGTDDYRAKFRLADALRPYLRADLVEHAISADAAQSGEPCQLDEHKAVDERERARAANQ